MLRIEFLLMLILCGTILASALGAQARLTQNLSNAMREMHKLEKPLLWSLSDFNATNCTPALWDTTHITLQCSRPDSSLLPVFLLIQ